jgi:DNA-binding transcriptional MerR regulator
VGDGLLGIGAFSRASFLSVKQLRAYHEAGILVPAQVDHGSGYRSYRTSQLTDAAVILRLRSLDLPLPQVRRIVEARDPDLTRAVLADHAAVMRSRLEDVTRIVTELDEGIDRPGLHTPVHVSAQPAVPTLAVCGHVTEATFAATLDGAFTELLAVAERIGVPPAGPLGALYAPQIADDGPEAVEVYLPLGSPAARPDGGGVRSRELPATTVAVAVHAGSYDTIADTYRQLGAWVAEHATPAEERVREVYEVGPHHTGDESRFRTLVQWPIVPVGS